MDGAILEVEDDEIWSDTRPWVHSVGGHCPSPTEGLELSTEDPDRTMTQAAKRVLAKIALAWK